ncbi:hypothetical protein F7U66_01975 [Vibrio parahaemolyticus]|nr:hypothetical protein [Vibrio parahaemolyticus]
MIQTRTFKANHNDKGGVILNFSEHSHNVELLVFSESKDSEEHICIAYQAKNEEKYLLDVTVKKKELKTPGIELEHDRVRVIFYQHSVDILFTHEGCIGDVWNSTITKDNEQIPECLGTFSATFEELDGSN